MDSISKSDFHREIFLFLRLFQLVLPFFNAAHGAAERQKLFLVIDQFLPAGTGERIILLQEYRLLRAHFLAKAQKMQRSMLISNSCGIFSALGRSAVLVD